MRDSGGSIFISEKLNELTLFPVITYAMKSFYTPKDYGNANYLIYSYVNGGSILIDCAKTEEEAKEKKKMYEKNGNGSKQIMYIWNNPYSW